MLEATNTEKNAVLQYWGRSFRRTSKIIRWELARGMVEHELGDIPFSRTEYNVDYAQIDAEEKMKYKGPMPKLGKHFELVERISVLLLQYRYSPCSVGMPGRCGNG